MDYITFGIAGLAIIIAYVAYVRGKPKKEPKLEKYHWTCDRCARKKTRYKISSNKHGILMDMIQMHNHDFHMGKEDQ